MDFPQYTNIFYGTRLHTHLISRFLSTLGCWLGLQLLALLGWRPLDLGRVELVHQLHGERGQMGPLRIYRQREDRKLTGQSWRGEILRGQYKLN